MYPVLFDISGLEIRSYDFFVFLAVIAGFSLLFIKTRGLQPKEKKALFLLSCLLFIPFLAGSLLGGYIDSLFTAERSWKFGDTSFYWGIAASVLSFYIICRRAGLDIRQFSDLLAAPVAAGFFLVRIGCFLNGCCFGAKCGSEFPLPYIHPRMAAGLPFEYGTALYPYQLFEAVLSLALLASAIIAAKKIRKKGLIMPLMLGAYAFSRFFLEFFRYNPLDFTLSIGQIWSIVMFFSCLIYLHKTVKEN